MAPAGASWVRLALHLALAGHQDRYGVGPDLTLGLVSGPILVPRSARRRGDLGAQEVCTALILCIGQF